MQSGLTADRAHAQGRPPAAAIVLLSDGTSTSGADPLAARARPPPRRCPVDTVALGTATGRSRSPAATAPPRKAGAARPRVARRRSRKAAGGQTYAVADAGHLNAVYEQLGAKLGHRHVKQKVADEFAGGALVLLLLGSAMSLRWFGRLI